MSELADLVDPARGFVDPTVYTDPGVYERELELVFGRSWLFLAHDSQLPRPGSFVQSYMGEDAVLVVRQRDNSVKAFLNQCRHRGMRICRADQGTSKTFTCSYHGWAYDLEGNLISVPLEERAYRNKIDKSLWGAQKVPRIAYYKGLWFGTWSEEIPEFEEYIGDMAYFLDATVDRWDNGIEFVPGVTKWVIDCNWKLAAEQFASDMYHAPISHTSAMMALVDDPEFFSVVPPEGTPGGQYAGNGHGSGSFWFPELAMPDPIGGPVWSQWLAEQEEQVGRRIGLERATKVPLSHNTIFPNFSWLVPASTMRVWHPRGPGQIEVWAWTYVPVDAPAEVKASMRQGTQRTFSPAGAFETDDGENWTEIQQVLRGWRARKSEFNVQMGLGFEERDNRGWKGLSDDVYSEMAARGFYQRWSDLMRGMSWTEIKEADRVRNETLGVTSRD